MATITTHRRPLSRYRAPVPPRHLPPIPEQWLPSMAAFRTPPPLWQFIFLSLLLHALFIALFGAPSGGSSEGRAMWGSMQVELRGLLVERDPAPAVTLPGRLKMAEELALPPPARQDRGAAEGAVPMTPPAETQAAATAPLGPAIVEVPTPFPRLLDRLPKPEAILVDPPALRVPPPTEGRDLRPPARERLERAPIEVPAPLPVVPHAGTERALAEPPPVSIPLAQPLPAPPVPAAQPQFVPEAAAAPATQPVEKPAVEVTAIPVPSLESVAPRAGEVAAPIDMAPLPRIEAAPAAPQMQPAVQPPAAAPATPEPEAMSPRFGAPSVAPSTPRRPGARPGDAPSSDYDPTAPSLDPDALRARAGRIAREGSGQRALLPFPMPAVPAKKSQMEAAIENARKPDCRTAYQGLGLAAIVPLVANEFGEGNCRW